MCLVIDTCTFDSVFDPHSKHHPTYEPIISWLIEGRGKIIFGGSKFAREIRGKSFLRILTEFEKRGKLLRVSDSKVDNMGKKLKAIEPRKEFNDEHLVALVIITKCCVVCTNDKRAVPYLKRTDFYPKGVKPPKIYRYKNHAPLCRNEHVVPACR